MVLMNAGSKARYVSSITNQNQGGGSKKAGFAYEVGRSHWSNIFIEKRPLSFMRTLPFTKRNVSQSRPIGSTTQYNIYWNIPGTK
jgi:hypothetical protein